MFYSHQVALSGKTVAAPPTDLQVEEIQDAAALEALAPEWEAHFAACPDASPFQSPQWLLTWRRRFLKERLWTLVVRRAGQLTGILPLFIHAPGDGERQLTLLGNGLSDRLDLLAGTGEAQAVGAAVMAHIARADLWTCCDFRDLPPESALLAAPLPLRVACDTIEAEEPCPALRLPEPPLSVLDLLSQSRRSDFRRRLRRLGELGPVRIETASASSRAEHLAGLVRLHGQRWSLRGERGVLADEDVVAFHEEATAALLQAGMLRLDVLRVGERIIAAHYGLRRGVKAYSYLHSFDPEFAAFGPGSLLIAHGLETAAAEGVRVFDFLRGRETYKYAWGAVDQPQFRRRVRR